MKLGYEINLEELCKNQDFDPSQVVLSELVFPAGAVPNSALLWVRVALTNGARKFVTLSLMDFHRYVDLPESSIGGWTEGDVGSDLTGLDPRYLVVDGDQRSDNSGHHAGDEADDPGRSEPVRTSVLDGPEGAEEAVATGVPDSS